MSATDTSIGVSLDTRRALRRIKAEENVHTYDAAIGVALEAYGPNDAAENTES